MKKKFLKEKKVTIGISILLAILAVTACLGFFANIAEASYDIQINFPVFGTTIYKGSTITISGYISDLPWGTNSAQYKLDLYKGTYFMQNIGEGTSNGSSISTEWKVPITLINGNDYRIKATRPASKSLGGESVTYTPNFYIVPTCLTGTEFNLLTNKCEAISCSSPFVFDPASNTCKYPQNGTNNNENTSRDNNQYVSHIDINTCPDSAVPECEGINMSVSDTTATIFGVGGPDLTVDPRLPTTGYFRYSLRTIPPIFCNDIYGPGMHSTGDSYLGTDSGTVLFSNIITGLKPDSTYYYCAVASNDKDISYGKIKSFHTSPCISCQQTTVTTSNPLVLDSNTVSLSGYFSATSDVTTYFQYRKTPPAPSLAVPTIDMEKYPWLNASGSITGYSTNSYSVNGFANASGYPHYTLSGLSPATDYDVRLVACVSPRVLDKNGDCVNQGNVTGGEEKIGNIKTFTTKAATGSTPGQETCVQTGTCPIINQPACDTGTIYNNLSGQCEPIPGGQYCDIHPDSRLCPPAAPDLTAGAVYPDQAVPDEGTTFYADISNIGKTKVGNTGQISSVFQFDNNSNHYSGVHFSQPVYIGGIAAGAKATIKTMQVFPVGVEYARACADMNANGEGSVAESNENNNCGPWTRILLPPNPPAQNGPDLIAGMISPMTVVSGTSTNFTVPITNQGNDSTGTSGLTSFFQAGTNPVNGGTITPLGPGGSGPAAAGSTVTATRTVTLNNTGTVYMRACADASNSDLSGGTVSETNENNNCGPWTAINVVASLPSGPDLTTGAVTGASSVAPGASASYSAVIYNQGTADANTNNGKISNLFEYSSSASGADILATQVVDSTDLQAGKWVSIKNSYTFPSSGAVYIRACADKSSVSDQYGSVDEGPNHVGEGNNCGSWTKVTVSSGGGNTTYNHSSGNWNGIWNGKDFSGSWNDGNGNIWKGTWNGIRWTSGNWTSGSWKGLGMGSGTGSGSSAGSGSKVGDHATPPSDAIVRYHEGVETVFVRQIVNRPELAAALGYKSGMNLQSFANTVADNLARYSFGYISSSGTEIRVTRPDVAAYELRLGTGNTLSVYEYYSDVIVDIRMTNTTFKNKTYYEYYYQK